MNKLNIIEMKIKLIQIMGNKAHLEKNLIKNNQIKLNLNNL